MFRGMTKFTCDDCGNKFMGMDCEWRCTVYTAPVKYAMLEKTKLFRIFDNVSSKCLGLVVKETVCP